MGSKLATSGRGVYTTNVELWVHECHQCAITYGIPNELDERARKDPSVTFYCPNGHSAHYPGDTEAKKERRRAERAERLLEQERDARERAVRQRDEANRSRAALKGALTKAKKRAGAGMCPVSGCKRHFQNLKRHVDRMHPEVMKELRP